MCPGDLAPDHPDLGAANLSRRAVDESDLLAQVEGCGLGVIDAIQFEKTIIIRVNWCSVAITKLGKYSPRVGIVGLPRTLVAEVTTPGR